MKYDFRELSHSQSALTRAQQLLTDAMGALVSVSVSDGDAIIASINSIKSKTSEIINIFSQVNNQIGGLISRIEDAEKSNQELLDEWDRSMAAILGNPMFNAMDTTARQRLLDIIFSFDDLLDTFAQPCPEGMGGTIETFRGSTVYLPYGYDPDDKDTKYNVMLLLGGIGNPSNYWFDQTSKDMNGKMLLDDMIYNGKCDPLIVASMQCNPSGLTSSFLPSLVERYNTYAASSKDEDIKAARNHFAIAGFSQGGYNTANFINTASDYFSWFGCVSSPKVEGGINIKRNDINYIYYAYGKGDASITKDQTLISYGQTAGLDSERFISTGVDIPEGANHWLEIETGLNNFKSSTGIFMDNTRTRIDQIIDGGHNVDTCYPALYNMLQIFFNNND